MTEEERLTTLQLIGKALNGKRARELEEIIAFFMASFYCAIALDFEEKNHTKAESAECIRDDIDNLSQNIKVMFEEMFFQVDAKKFAKVSKTLKAMKK